MHDERLVITDLIHLMARFYRVGYDPEKYIEIACKNTSGYAFYLTPRINIGLSPLLTAALSASSFLEINQVPAATMEPVLRYLGHHKGVEPAPIPSPVRSIHMAQIVEDQWDATFINGFEKKETFELVLAANYLGI